VDVVDGAAAADTAPPDAPADGVNDGLRSPLTADVPFSAEATEAAEVAESAESAASVAVPVFWLVSQPLSPELIACRLPCRSLLGPLSPVAPDEPAARPLALPIVSAGSGTSVLDPASVVFSSAVSAVSAVAAVSADAVFADAAGAAASPDFVVSSESPEAAVSPEEEESPLAPPVRRGAPERDFPVLVRDDDMMPLSTIVSVASPSGSTFRLGGAMMSGGWVVRPASSTPSSLVLNGAPMYLCVDTIRDPFTIETQLPPE
jgi:hypothetical protein